MGKVTYIKKSRKENTCSKCHKIIPVGSAYWKGELYMMRPIVRCTKCGLRHYEVTTSDYVMTIGRLVEDWQEDFPVGDTTAEEIISVLEETRDTCQENFDNIPEQLQDADAGSLLQERIDELEGAIYDLESMDDWNSFLERAYESLDEEDTEIIDKEQEKHEGEDYSEWFDDFLKAGSETANHWKEALDEELTSEIDEILGQLSY